MKVLELPSWYLPYGGHFVRHQALALRERGVEVHILANNMLSWNREKLSMFDLSRFPLRPYFSEEEGVPVLRNYTRPIPRGQVLNIRLWAHRTVQLYAMYAARYGHPDVIHVHSTTWGAYAASLIKKKWGIPYVVTEHRGVYSCLCQYAKDFFLEEYTPFIREGLSNADYIIPVGDLLIPKLRTYLMHEVPIRVISNIVDTEFFVPGKEKKPHQPFRWISVNGFKYVKGYDILLPAFDALCDQGADITLTLVGENFEQKDFQILLKQCRHLDRIRFTGELDREGVRRELQEADAFVMSSRVEAQPVAILEALSCGLPVAGTEVIPPYTLPEQLGIRVPVEKPDLLADAMKHVMEYYAEYSVQEARAYVESIARGDLVTKQLIDVYKCVLHL